MNTFISYMLKDQLDREIRKVSYSSGVEYELIVNHRKIYFYDSLEWLFEENNLDKKTIKLVKKYFEKDLKCQIGQM